VTLLRPVDPPDYVDFYSSLEHAENLGRMFRPGADPLPENWRWLPAGYHGRSGSVVVSGTPVRRPCGQLPPGPGERPAFGPSRALDFELELGFVTGDGPPLGEPLPVDGAEEVIFGVALVNDWSARDIQRWEYQPLGPFLGKSFATSIAAWVTPLEALAACRATPPPQDPPPLSYLRASEPWALDLELSVALEPGGGPETTIARTNARGLYWTMAQQLAHATAGGAAVRAGDLYASGTISGASPGSYGSLIELSRGGREPVALAGGDSRAFVEDGDTVVLRGRSGAGPHVELAEVRGTVVPARG
jgi:fumarylacetoacetase